MDNENSGQHLPEAAEVDNAELLITPTGEASNEVSDAESTTDTPNVSMLDDKPPEAVADFSDLGRVAPPEVGQVETSSNLPAVETSTQLDTVEHPSASLTDKFDDHIEKQKQHNVFEYVNIVAEHAKSAVVQSGWLENPDGTKGDPFARVILSVDHDEIMEFIEKYGTNFTLGLPNGHELSAKVSLSGDEFARNEITVELPLSGRAADEFFREDTTNPIVTHAFDVAYAQAADEQKNQLNDAQQ